MSPQSGKRKGAQQLKREGAHRLHLALSAGQLGDWSWDAATDRVTMGPRTAELFGLSDSAHVTWEGLREHLHPDDRDRAREAVEVALRDQSDYDIEYRVIRPDGVETWIASKGRGVYDNNGNATGMIGVVHDVTERKKLELIQHRMAAVVESSDDAIVSKDLKGIVQTWNTGAERIFGYTASEMVGSSILRLIPPELRSEETSILDRQRRGERIDHYETVRVTKDGRRIDVSLTVSPIRDSRGVVVGASKVARDITARKRAEQELLEAERRARSEVERISYMKDEFLATLSHELRTPLNAIVGWAQMLRNRTHADADVLEGLAVIDRNAKVQAQLIEDLLDMSRIISGKVRLDNQRVDVHDVVRAAVASVRHLAVAKEITLQLELDAQAGTVWGDPNRLQQVVWNLVSNAIKFTPTGGRVLVKVARTGGHVELTVADNGQGIAAGFLPHLFERFRQADSSTTRYHGGLGLGLSIVKSLVELHGGSVRASSDGLGKGATFRVEMPAMAANAHSAESPNEPPLRANELAAAAADQPSLHGLAVLVIDDERDTLDLVRRVLEECGARVFVAESAKAGLDLLVREKPDILISDIGMPDEDGYTLIRQVRALKPRQGGKIPAAAVSAFARPEDRTKALRAGYQMHLAKPVDPTELTAVVASLATRKPPVRARA
ncbi:MAG TPA: PAS domain S-box protein [Vicinamibacterales bacterium]|nr:PAS domain S-box protein [Vicinamibacterales bacterium]